MSDLWEKKLELHRLEREVWVLRTTIRDEEEAQRRARLRRLPPHQRKVLGMMINHHTGYPYRWHIARLTGLGKDQVSRALGGLRRLGFVELHQGLFNDDGQVAGSAYGVTARGAKWWSEVEQRDFNDLS